MASAGRSDMARRAPTGQGPRSHTPPDLSPGAAVPGHPRRSSASGRCPLGPSTCPQGRPWIVLALHTPATTHLTAWRRPGGAETPAVRLPERAAGATRSHVLFPAACEALALWNPDSVGLTVTLLAAPCAALLRITRTKPDAP
ncbi:hypothetical protein GCM10018783_01240 [Streptomyces griseosporeus]|nr:hypothetical protein GCM10018783_01240 [Streptomyces griseosporeus]